MEAMDIQAVESKLSDVTVTAVPMPKSSHNTYQCSTNSNNIQNNEKQLPSLQTTISSNNSGLSKYAQLLGVIEEMGRDVRPTYSGSKSSAERLKRGIIHARILVRECLVETERSARQ